MRFLALMLTMAAGLSACGPPKAPNDETAKQVPGKKAVGINTDDQRQGSTVRSPSSASGASGKRGANTPGLNGVDTNRGTNTNGM